MKKLLLLLLAVMIATASVNAQNGYDTKHEVAVGYGFLSITEMGDFFQNFITIIAGENYDITQFVGPINAEYFYHVNEWFSVGGTFSFASAKMDVLSSYSENNQLIGKENDKYYTFIPAVKFNWLRTPYFDMYSKLGAGASFINTDYEPVDTTTDQPDKSNNYMFNFQVTPLGLEAGSAQFRGFIEAGLGEQGVVSLGLRYKF